MKLTIHDAKDEEVKEFTKREWAKADLEHYGKVIDFEAKDVTVVARDDNNQIIGKLSIHMVAGVGEIKEVLVAHSHHGTGVGTALMKKAEEIARDHKLHKLWLYTGKGWKAEEFYKSLGYEKSGELNNHLVHRDWIIYSKFLG